MALTDFREEFDNMYEEVFNKVLVGLNYANTRFERKLKFGESVQRVAYDVSAVTVRSVTRGSASTIDAITDSTELLTINLEKEAAFHISDGEVTQAGPLNPGEVIGAQIGQKVAQDLDANILYEVTSALYDFDNGDLTTGASTGTAITLSSTTVPQMVTRMPAKLHRKNNQSFSNMVFIVDAYGAADVEQYLLGKEINIAAATFQNGYAGLIRGAELAVSENLTGEAVLSLATNVTADDTVTIEGVTFTFVASPSAAGHVDVGADADTSRANLAAAINAGAGAGTAYVELSAADRATLTAAGITATNNNTANTLTVVGKGSGRLTVAETLTDGTDAWTKNFIHAYYGKKGAIDVVVQDLSKVDMRPTADRRGTNVFSSYLAGIKTFADGAKKFLDVHINA